MQLSIIIPTLNEESAIEQTLHNVAACAPGAEVVVVDGGSTDRTAEKVAALLTRLEAERRCGMCRLIHSERGRGRQMNAGARAASGSVLLFLHADTLLPPDARSLLQRAVNDPRVVGGNFRIRFVPRSFTADLYTAIYNLRTRFRIFYGDSAIWLRRETFEALGGYARDRIMEDLVLVLKLRKAGRLVCLPSPVESSARRFQGGRRNFRTLLLWGWLHLLLLCGAEDARMERLYPPAR